MSNKQQAVTCLLGIGQKLVGIDSWKADGLLSNTSRIRKVMQKTSTFIDLENDNRVLLALQTASGHKIQIKRFSPSNISDECLQFRGDISKVTSDAIVNAANSQLFHGSGVALVSFPWQFATIPLQLESGRSCGA